MERDWGVDGGEDNSIWQTVRLIAGAALLVLAGLSISTLTDPVAQSNPSMTLLGEGR